MLRSRKFCQSGSDLVLVFVVVFHNFFSLMRGGMNLNGVLLACRLWPNIECWLGSFAILRGSGPVLLKTFCDFPVGVLDPLSTSASGHAKH